MFMVTLNQSVDDYKLKICETEQLIADNIEQVHEMEKNFQREASTNNEKQPNKSKKRRRPISRTKSRRKEVQEASGTSLEVHDLGRVSVTKENTDTSLLNFSDSSSDDN